MIAFCVHCGEPLQVDAPTCPGCKKPVGQSSIGVARTRQVSSGKKKVVIAVAIAALLAMTGALVFKRTPKRSWLDDGGRLRLVQAAAPSLVTVQGPKGRVPGVVIKVVGEDILVATQLSSVGVGQQVRVSHGSEEAPGFGLLSGRGQGADGFVMVLVPGGVSLGVESANLLGRPQLDETLMALTPSGGAGPAGTVLSFEDGPGAGVLVHDVDVTKAEMGYGLWVPPDRLRALPALGKNAGAQMAVAAHTLLERMLFHAVKVPAGISQAELPIPIDAGHELAVVLTAPGLTGFTAKVGSNGKQATARMVMPGTALAEFPSERAGQLQVGLSESDSKKGARVFVVALGRL